MAVAALTAVVAGNVTKASEYNILTDFVSAYDGTYAPNYSSMHGIAAKTADYTILDDDLINHVEMTCGGQYRTVTLPTLADNQHRIIRISNADGDGFVKVDGEGAETINGKTEVYLYSQYDYIEIQGTSGTWQVLGVKSSIPTGWVSNSDWTARHLGTVNVDYDNLSGTFLVGETVTEDTTNATGIILEDDGSTLVVYGVTSTGVFNNNNGLTGGTSGATADVDEAGTGTTKNLDSNVTHNFTRNLKQLSYRLMLSTDGTENNSFEIGEVSWDSNVATLVKLGYMFYSVDTDNFKLQTATDGLGYIDDAGATGAIDTEDWYYNIIVEWKI